MVGTPPDPRSARPPALPTLLSFSERNIVVHVAVAGSGAGRHRAARRSTGGTARPEIAAGIIGPETPATASSSAIQHGQRGVEVLQHDFGRVAFDIVLVGPFPRLQLALD